MSMFVLAGLFCVHPRVLVCGMQKLLNNRFFCTRSGRLLLITYRMGLYRSDGRPKVILDRIIAL